MLDDFAVNFAILRILSKKDFAIPQKNNSPSPHGLGENIYSYRLCNKKELVNRDYFNLQSFLGQYTQCLRKYVYYQTHKECALEHNLSLAIVVEYIAFS